LLDRAWHTAEVLALGLQNKYQQKHYEFESQLVKLAEM